MHSSWVSLKAREYILTYCVANVMTTPSRRRVSTGLKNILGSNYS